MKTTTRVLTDGWRVRELDARPIPHSDLKAWLPAEVPGHVHADLLRAGVIPDPFLRMHERTVQWVDEVDWVYECTFEVSDDELAGARHLLRFEGLDTVAKVELDDATIAETDNMFVPHEVDVTERLTAGEHVLRVTFTAADRVGVERRAAWLAADPERDGYKHALLERSFVRKAQYAWGWDWGPRLRGCGLWQPVHLVRVPAARITAWQQVQAFAGDDATLVVRVDVEGEADVVEASLGDGTQTAPVVDGRAEVTIEVPKVRRWWPAGSGDAALYDLSISLRTGGELVDDRVAKVGFRTVELILDDDAKGQRFGFRINGQDVYAKGANWIPDDILPARTTVARMRTLLELAVECGMNMVRIWGGGIYETDEFYDLCDELGLLVWQDFPYACAHYPEGDAEAAIAAEEATAAVRRLRNRASLALWCGNNENQWLGWMGAYGQVPLLGNRLYHEVLPAVVAAEDPATPYWPSSPFGAHEPGQDPSGDESGDSHYWNVWHGEGDWKHYVKCTSRFVSEFGFSAPPDHRTLEDALDPADLGVDTPGMRWHDKTGKGYETYLGYIGLHYPRSETFDDLVYFGQLNQADAMTFGIEHFRRLMPHNMGTLVWQLNDCWPVHSWAWIDSNLRPKAAWYRAKRFYAPLLASPSFADGHLRVHLVSDATSPIDGELSVRALDATGRVVWSHVEATTAAPGTSTAVLDVALPQVLAGMEDKVVVHVSFAGSENVLFLVEPKDLALPPPTLASTVTAEADGFVVELSSDVVALSVRLDLDGLDPRWTDNYVDVLPGSPRSVSFRVEGDHTADDLAARLRLRTLRDAL